MKSILFPSLKALGILISGLLGLAIVYLIMALVLSIIPVNKNFTETNQPDNYIYLLSNGVHLDIVMPKTNPLKDWGRELNINPIIEEQVKLIGFGWGDREFYLNTPEWSDLRFGTAFNALFLKGPSALHVSYYGHLPENDQCIKLYISKDQYLRLAELIKNSFTHNNSDQIIQIQHAGYNQFDQFYEANRSYQLFYTCNTWSNRVLRESDLKACLWTPFDKGILWQYRGLNK